MLPTDSPTVSVVMGLFLGWLSHNTVILFFFPPIAQGMFGLDMSSISVFIFVAAHTGLSLLFVPTLSSPLSLSLSFRSLHSQIPSNHLSLYTLLFWQTVTFTGSSFVTYKVSRTYRY
ncbi:hypothetical protein NP493_661g03011 [Ridgeia piscesae]|uniref:Uncharacterized protein n=1 Tax=Ridgeia piscesae TaxID=27915 RepID=A0AAD9KRS3_RIDPI|nr:hypothetical protein NP493_661g03011 [Ridgeia piscesae]